ncbi:MAG: hypothetical protein EOO15_10670 [Chitinophagaceae bacterium]|nr:MAG: hypothetical protein EOO15_10670 [Chitinophagaceae bacterium]
MKSFSKIFSVLVLALSLVACDKKDVMDGAANGNAPKLESNTVTLAPQAVDSLRNVLNLRWTNANYSVNMATKYIIQIDSVGKNFSNPLTREITNAQSTDFIAKDLNNWMLSRGWAFNQQVSLEMRVISSYSNNNERLISNVIPIKMTPYVIPPRVTPPASNRLFITGGDFGWNNSATMPAQELVRTSNTMYSGIFQLGGGQSYLLLPNAGDWGSKFGGTGPNNNTNNPNGDAFQAGGSDLVSPSAAGWYRLDVDFQSGRFTWTPVTTQVPAALYFTGDAFPEGWTNSPTAAQQLTRVNSVTFQKTAAALTPGKYYKFLSSPGNWQPQYGGSSATGGALGANLGGGNDPDAVPTPAAAGNYTITVNFLTNTYTVQ